MSNVYSNMSERSVNKYKYAIIQHDFEKEKQTPCYLVICSEWVTTHKEQKYFYWPRNGLCNKTAVRNCTKVDFSTWIRAPIKEIVEYSNNFYDAVLHCVTLSRFNIDESRMKNLNEVYATISELVDCSECSKMLHEITVSLTFQCPRSSSQFPTSIKLSRDELCDFNNESPPSPSLLWKKKQDITYPSATVNSMSPSLVTPRARRHSNTSSCSETPALVNKLSSDYQTNVDSESVLSPSLLFNRKRSILSTKNITSNTNYKPTSLLIHGDVSKKAKISVRLQNKFEELDNLS